MIYDLIIIGGGPAGIAAGIYGARKKIKTLLLTDKFGGQSIMASEIQNFIGFKAISGVKLSQRLEEHLRSQENVEIKTGIKVLNIEKKACLPIGKEKNFIVKTENGESFESKTVLLATGKRYRHLKAINEDKFEGKGIFYCSICDAPLMKNKNVAVVGGGNSGLAAVNDLLPYATKIFLLEYSKELKADQILIDKAKTAGVKIITSAEIKEIVGDVFVNGIKYQDRILNEIKELSVSGVFVEVGYEPNNEIIKNLVSLNNKNEIIIDAQTQKTSLEGIWAAGDATDVLYNQINVAIGDAIKAVLNIYDYLKSVN